VRFNVQTAAAGKWTLPHLTGGFSAFFPHFLRMIRWQGRQQIESWRSD